MIEQRRVSPPPPMITEKHPPYSSYKGFRGALDRLREEVELPPRLNASYIRKVSEHGDYGINNTLAFFGLTSDEQPTERLRQLLDNIEDTREWQLLLREAYGPLLDDIDLKQISRDELAELFKIHFPETSETTIPKAVGLFTKLAQYAGLPLATAFGSRANGKDVQEEPEFIVEVEQASQIERPYSIQYENVVRFEAANNLDIVLDLEGEERRLIIEVMDRLRELARLRS